MLKKEMKLTYWAIRGQFRTYCIMLLLLFATTELYAQNWEKKGNKNKWGDITSYSYVQGTRGTAHGNEDIPVAVGFGLDANEKNEYGNYLFVMSQTTGVLEFHPGAGFINESVTLSLRKDGVTKSYTGSTEASQGSYNQVWMGFTITSELRNMLRGPGQWDVLIEGKRWYIRTTIRGNLPSE